VDRSHAQPHSLLLLMMLIIIGRWKGWFRPGGPRRVHHEDLNQQLDADFPEPQRVEARALLESIAQHAAPADRDLVRRKVLQVVRGDLGKLRRAAPSTISSLQKIYGLMGTPPDTDVKE
jgi:hypothetical protein